MMRERRDCAAQHLHNCADLECFAEFHRDCPHARETAASVVLLPTYPRYSERDVARNIEVIRRYFGRD
jgi:dTDP-4-amino-4,6-dideoxygalactose transaminase